MRIFSILFILFFTCASIQAQEKKENKKTPQESRSDREWDEIGDDLGETFSRLGKVLGREMQSVGKEIEREFQNDDFWRDLGRDMARTGKEAADALEDATSDWSCAENNRWNDPAGYDEEKTKKFSKSFKLSANQQLGIENKFGKVHINTWDKPEATVDVVIIARASSESKAQSLLDRISIAVSEDSDEIVVRTDMDDMKNWGNGNKQSFEINYTVNMPRNNPLRVKNSFGDTYVADRNGKCNLQASYGNLKAEKLNNADNYVKVAFGNGRVAYVKSGDMKVSYGKLEVTDCGKADIESSYSELEVSNVQAAKVRAKYGSVDIGTTGKGFQSLDIDGSFSDIDLRIPERLGFDFDVRVSYSDLDWNSLEAKFTSVEKSGSSKTLVGTCGKSSGGNIRVASRYGDVNFRAKD